MNFEQRVMTLIRAIPAGRVSSYGVIAALAGSPRAAQAVGMILRRNTIKHDLPWQRIINSQGRISIINMDFPDHVQAELLKAEGVGIVERDSAYYISSNDFFIEPEELEKNV